MLSKHEREYSSGMDARKVTHGDKLPGPNPHACQQNSAPTPPSKPRGYARLEGRTSKSMSGFRLFSPQAGWRVSIRALELFIEAPRAWDCIPCWPSGFSCPEFRFPTPGLLSLSPIIPKPNPPGIRTILIRH